jgi:hypothetical protein
MFLFHNSPTLQITAGVNNTSLCETADEISYMQNEECSTDISFHLNTLEQLESDEHESNTNMDYEAGGDDLFFLYYHLSSE